MFRYLILLLVGVLLVSMCGCAVMDTGPKLVSDVVATGKAVAIETFKDLRAQQGMAGMRATVNDPEYYMEGMTGPVYFFAFRLGLRRADLSAHVEASLVEDTDVTEADINLARDILSRPDLDRERRDAMLMELTKQGINFWEKLLGLGGDDRTTTDPDVE